MSRVVAIPKRRKVKRADIVVLRNGYEVDDLWINDNVHMLFSHNEWRELFRLYSREVIRGRWSDYKIENNRSLDWIYFSLISGNSGSVSIGKHRIGNKFEYYLYETYRSVKRASSLSEIINHYETMLKK